jgi:hypothetical protein
MLIPFYSKMELNRKFLLDWKVMYFELKNFYNYKFDEEHGAPYWNGGADGII